MGCLEETILCFVRGDLRGGGGDGGCERGVMMCSLLGSSSVGVVGISSIVDFSAMLGEDGDLVFDLVL